MRSSGRVLDTTCMWYAGGSMRSSRPTVRCSQATALCFGPWTAHWIFFTTLHGFRPKPNFPGSGFWAQCLRSCIFNMLLQQSQATSLNSEFVRSSIFSIIFFGGKDRSTLLNSPPGWTKTSSVALARRWSLQILSPLSAALWSGGCWLCQRLCAGAWPNDVNVYCVHSGKKSRCVARFAKSPPNSRHQWLRSRFVCFCLYIH